MPNYSRVYTRTTKQYVYWFERDSIGIALYDPLRSEKNRFTSVDAAFTINDRDWETYCFVVLVYTLL